MNRKKIGKITRSVFVVLLLAFVAAAVIGIKYRSQVGYYLLRNDPSVVKQITKDLNEPVPEISVDYISKKIDNISSLQTAKITYGCMVDFKEGSVRFITKKAFSMFYEATAYAGVDVSQITVEEKDGKYVVRLPAAEIEEKPKIDPASFVFYDKTSGMLNQFDPEDTGKALEYAEKDVYYQATTDQLLNLANDNAVKIVKNLLLCFLAEDQFEVIPGIKDSASKIKSPITSTEALNLDYEELEQKLRNAGFDNIKLYPIEDVKIGVFTKEGEIESVTIDGQSSFKKSSIFKADSEIVIKYHAKKTK